MGLGAAISPSLAQWLISSYSWRQAYLVLGLIAFVVIIPLAQFLRHSPQRAGLKPYGEDETIEDKQSLASSGEGVSLKQAVKTRRFWFFSLRLFSWMFFVTVITVHLVPHTIDIGISATIAASLMSIVGITSLIGRNLMGFIADKVGAAMALTILFATTTLALIWLLFAKEVWMLYLFALVFGIAYAGGTPVQTLATVESFGLKSLGTISAALQFSVNIGAATGSPLAGRIFDVTGNYSLAFIISVLFSAFAFILSLSLLKAKGLVR